MHECVCVCVLTVHVISAYLRICMTTYIPRYLQVYTYASICLIDQSIDLSIYLDPLSMMPNLCIVYATTPCVRSQRHPLQPYGRLNAFGVVCVYIYIYIYTHTYSYIHMYIYIYICIHIYTYVHTYVYEYIYIYTHVCIHICVYVYIYIYIYTYG